MEFSILFSFFSIYCLWSIQTNLGKFSQIEEKSIMTCFWSGTPYCHPKGIKATFSLLHLTYLRLFHHWKKQWWRNQFPPRIDGGSVSNTQPCKKDGIWWKDKQGLACRRIMFMLLGPCVWSIMNMMTLLGRDFLWGMNIDIKKRCLLV